VDLSERLRRIFSVPFYQAAFWGHTADLLDAFFWPFLIGPSLGALTLATITYAVAVRVLTERARQRTEDASVLPGGAEKRTADGHVDDA
jgi:hypothetical protein